MSDEDNIMALPTTISVQGATIVFGSSSWTSGITGFGIGEQTRAAKKVTNIATTGGHQYKPSSLVDFNTLPIRFQFDPNNPPLISAAAETITVTWATPAGGSSGATLIGTGFMESWSASGDGDDEEMTGELTVRWDGNTPPAFTDSA